MRGTDVYSCSKCKGVWFSKSDLLNVFSTVSDDANSKLDEMFSSAQRAKTSLSCPENCGSPLDELNVEKLSLDVCRECKGLWFDPGELDTLAGRVKSRRKDSSDYWYYPILDILWSPFYLDIDLL